MQYKTYLLLRRKCFIYVSERNFFLNNKLEVWGHKVIHTQEALEDDTKIPIKT